MAAKVEIEKYNPIRITDNDTDQVYELDFDRDSVAFAEMRGFKIDEVMDYPVTKFPELFYYAFRKNHSNVSRHKTDSLFLRLGGITPKILERLGNLYSQAQKYNTLTTEEEVGKNGNLSVEL